MRTILTAFALAASGFGQVPAAPTVSAAPVYSSAPASSILASIGTTNLPGDTLSFVCASLPPAIPACPPSVQIPGAYSGVTVLSVRLSYAGIPILALPGLANVSGPLLCATCAWSNNPNPAPGDWLVAQAPIQGARFTGVTQQWSGYPALPQVVQVCSVCNWTVTNVAGQVTVSGP